MQARQVHNAPLNYINLSNNYRSVRTARHQSCTGESAALGRRMPWANRIFSKSMKVKILNFLREVEKIILVIFV